MTLIRRIAVVGIMTLSANSAYAYNKSAGSSHCDKPIFTDFQPAPNKYLQSFNEFSVLASANTTAASIEATVSSGSNKYHFTHKELKIEPQKSGRFEVSGKLPRPLEHGFARVSFTAHSKPGCEHTEGYLLRIQ